MKKIKLKKTPTAVPVVSGLQGILLLSHTPNLEITDTEADADKIATSRKGWELWRGSWNYVAATNWEDLWFSIFRQEMRDRKSLWNQFLLLNWRLRDCT